MTDSILWCMQSFEDMKTAVVALALVLCASVGMAQFGGGPFGGGGFGGGGGGYNGGGGDSDGGEGNGGQRGCPLPLLSMYSLLFHRCFPFLQQQPVHADVPLSPWSG